MKSAIKIIVIVILSLFTNNAWAGYEVRGKCGSSSIFYAEGELSKEPCSDQVVYEVIPEENKVIRKAVISSAGGLQADNSEYIIVYDNPSETIRRKNKTIQQHIIKAFGKVALFGGFEMLVIGDDFIMTVKSASNYFTIYFYNRQR